MKSIRFGFIAIAICGIAALTAGVQVERWRSEVAALTARQGAVSDQLIALRDVFEAILDLETGQRGYLLTGEPSYLEPYDSGRGRFQHALRVVNDLFRDDPTTAKELSDIALVAQGKLDELARTVELRRHGALADALAVVKTDEGKQLMDALRAKIVPLLVRLRELRAFALASVLGAVVILLILVLTGIAFVWLAASLRRLDQLQRQRAMEAMHDELTGLPNRRYLFEWLAIALAAAERRRKEPLVLLYVDLDGFKSVNDRFGHGAGDRVLQAVAQRLRAAVRGSDFVARLGGDEFVVALGEAPGPADLNELIVRLQRDLAAAPILEIADGAVSASIGTACYPIDGGNAEALLMAADRSMYAAKQARQPEVRLEAVSEPAEFA